MGGADGGATALRYYRYYDPGNSVNYQITTTTTPVTTAPQCTVTTTVTIQS